MKIFAVLILVGISLSIGYFFGQRERAPIEQSAAVIETKLQELVSRELRVYETQTDADEKLKKANEILGQIVEIFLLDLGLRLTPNSQIIATEERANVPEKLATGPPQIAPTEQSVRVGPIPVSARNLPPVNTVQVLKRIETKVNEATSDEEAFEALEELKHVDIGPTLKKKRALLPDQVQSIRGHFVGSVEMTDKSPAWLVDMNILADQVNPIKNSKYEILIERDGKQIGKTTGSGSLKDFFGTEEGDGGIVIDSNGNDGFMRVFWHARLDKFLGVMYLMDAAGEPKPAGRVRLSRVN